MQNSMVLFSGGKDSMYALEKIAEQNKIDLLVSMISEEGYTQFHACPETNKSFRETQLNLLGFPTTEINIGDNTNYLNELYLRLKNLVITRDIKFLIIGSFLHVDGGWFATKVLNNNQ